LCVTCDFCVTTVFASVTVRKIQPYIIQVKYLNRKKNEKCAILAATFNVKKHNLLFAIQNYDCAFQFDHATNYLNFHQKNNKIKSDFNINEPTNKHLHLRTIRTLQVTGSTHQSNS